MTQKPTGPAETTAADKAATASSPSTAWEENTFHDGPGKTCGGIQTGGVIVRVNEDSCYGLTHDEVKRRIGLLKGKIGRRPDSTVSLCFWSSNSLTSV